MDKYADLRAQGTNGANYDLETEDIITRLKSWDEAYSIDISEVEADKLTVHFESLPEDLEDLANEIYEICPDTIEQGFGNYGEMVEAAEEMGQDLPDEVQELVDGVDFGDDNYGLELLKRALANDQTVTLWWD